jgi:hypothetical protein
MSKYDRFIPTEYVPLPVDYYQAASSLKDQRTEDALNNIKSVADSYSNIRPVSRDAEAFYNQNVDVLKQRVGEVAKMKLGTPQAERKLNQIISDPEIVGNFEKVYMDAAYAAQRKKELDEYLKKNPEVNATDYLTAFNGLGHEEGDASKFNPDRFRNLAPLSDYYDVNKRIEEGVKSIGEDEVSQKRIFGDKYIEIKKSGKLPDKIRSYVVGMMATDPQLQAQLQRNLKYQYYQQDPTNLDNGKKLLASRYLQTLHDNYDQMATHIQDQIKGKTKKQLETDANLHSLVVGLDQMKDAIGKYDTMDTDTLNETMMAEAFKNGFGALANQKTSYAETYTPLAIAAYNWRQKWKMYDDKKQMLNGLMNPEPLTIMDARAQGPVADHNLKDYIQSTPELKSVAGVMDQHGMVNPHSATAANIVDFQPTTGKLSGKTAYVSSAEIVEVGKNEKPPAGYVKIGTRENAASDGGPSYKVYNDVYAPAKSNLKWSTNKDEIKANMYERAKQDMSSYLEKIGSSAAQYNDFKTDADLRAAVQDVANYKRSNESVYAPMYDIKASHSNDLANSIAAAIPMVGVTDRDGNRVTDSDKLQKLQEYLMKQDNKVVIHMQPATLKGDESVYSVTYNGDTYKIPMHKEFNQQLTVPRSIMKRFISNDAKPMEVGNDLIVGDMTKGGSARGSAIAGGATKQYQDAAGNIFKQNVAALKAAGLSEADATRKLNDEYFNAVDHIGKTGEGYPVKVNGKTVYITTPVRYREGKYYSQSSILPNSQRTVVPIDEYMKIYMRRFASPSNNPAMINPLSDDLKNKNMMQILMSGDNDNFQYNFD